MFHVTAQFQLDALIGIVVAFVLALAFMVLHRFMAWEDPNLIEHRASHVKSTSRLGGVAVAAAVLVSITYADVPVKIHILMSALPVFLMGLSEDLHHALKPSTRLTVASVSALLFMWMQGSRVVGIGVPIVDYVLSITIISAFFTIFCMVALTNALNFIDGINGLASGKTMIVAGAIFVFAQQYDELGLTVLSFAIFTSALGLFMLNFPHGRIFMGDAGSYTLGFLLAACLITLHYRHSEISPWAILLIIFWPIADMGHSILRRWLRGTRPDRADMIHMHHVVMRALTACSNGKINRRIANPLATSIILPLSIIPVMCGYIFRENNVVCAFLALCFFVGFFYLYIFLIRLSQRRARISSFLRL